MNVGHKKGGNVKMWNVFQGNQIKTKLSFLNVEITRMGKETKSSLLKTNKKLNCVYIYYNI